MRYADLKNPPAMFLIDTPERCAAHAEIDGYASHGWHGREYYARRDTITEAFDNAPADAQKRFCDAFNLA